MAKTHRRRVPKIKAGWRRRQSGGLPRASTWPGMAERNQKLPQPHRRRSIPHLNHGMYRGRHAGLARCRREADHPLHGRYEHRLHG